MNTHPYPIPNLGWKFYREMFHGMKFGYLTIENEKQRKEEKKKWNEDNKPVFEKKVKDITDTTLPAKEALKTQLLGHTQQFHLTTTYPGLVLGTGYAHQVSVEGECKLGFHFDHTSGLPIIPGSSVKGVLRSVFPGYVKIQQSKLKEDERKLKEEIAGQKKEYLTAIAELADFKTEHAWTALEMLLFEGKTLVEGEWKVTQKLFERIIFHDAVITDTQNPPKETAPGKKCERPFLGTDFLTPHINRDNPSLSPFTNPTPLQFLKVLPKVEFTFQFRIPEVLTVEWQEVSGPQTASLSREKLRSFFRRILLEQGIGAKTNVGYGQFAQDIPNPTVAGDSPPKEEAAAANEQPKPKPTNLTVYEGKRDQGKTIMARVIDPQNRSAQILLPKGLVTVEMGKIPYTMEKDTLVFATISSYHKKTDRILMLTYKGPI